VADKAMEIFDQNGDGQVSLRHPNFCAAFLHDLAGPAFSFYFI
jgi:hypothetical protein